MNDQQEPIVRILPSDKPCQRQIRIDKAGRAIMCPKPGYIYFPDLDLSLCTIHSEDAKQVIELELSSSHK